MKQPGAGKLSVIKLGGSALTVMGADGAALNRAAAKRLAAEIAKLSPSPLLLHGTGCFGKPPAIRYGYSGGKLAGRSGRIVSEVNQDLNRMSQELMAEFREAGLPVVPVLPESMFRIAGERLEAIWPEMAMDMLARDAIPVLRGGFAMDDAGGFRVCSSDDMAALLAIKLKADTLIYITKTGGVQANPHDSSDILPILGAREAMANGFLSPTPCDVTGGMAAKVKCGFAAAANGARTFIIDGLISGNMKAVLEGAPPIRGTQLFANDRSALGAEVF